MNRAREVGIPLLIMIACLAGPARAHHILGLPHYSYKENYPQVPTLEYPATTGPYDVLLTSYPGIPNPGDAASVTIYIKNRKTEQAYAQPVQVRVLQTFTFGRNREVLAPTRVVPLDQTHKFNATFPEDGEYVVELSMQVEGQTEVIPFLVLAGEPSATSSILVALAIGLLLFVVVIRAIAIKRKRRSGRLESGAPEIT
jgi:hypothetical protein